ncbi:MAG: ATP-dependent DNA ligase [Nakamurella sp.]
MLFIELADASAAVAATRSRLAKRALIAAAIRAAGPAAPDPAAGIVGDAADALDAGPTAAEPAEIALVVTYLSGSLRQRRTGVGWASLTSIPPPAEEPTLTVRQVDSAFEEIAAIGGQGSAVLRSAAVAALFGRATEPEQKLLRGLVFDEIRQGALDSLVQDGLAEAFGVPAKAVQRAAMLLGSTASAAVVLAASGLAGLEKVGLAVGVPVRPMLAASAPDPTAAIGKTGLPAVVDNKLDGIRVQVHRSGDAISIYTRSLDDITSRLPEIVAVVAALPQRQLVLDGEVLGIGADGRPLTFQVSASRTMTRLDKGDPAAGERVPLSLYCFDLLHVDDRDLLDEPLSERITVMAEQLPAELLVSRRVVDTVDEVNEVFARAVRDGFEGVVVKKLTAPYAAGRRDSGWVKLKPRHTFDLAVIAAEWGYGRREGWLSNLHLAARDPQSGKLVMLGKTFKGLTDEVLTWQTVQFQARESRRTKGTVYIDPPFVAEIAFDGVQASTRYPGGVALRFARVLGYRPDKSVDEVDTIDSIVALGAPEGIEPES